MYQVSPPHQAETDPPRPRTANGIQWPRCRRATSSTSSSRSTGTGELWEVGVGAPASCRPAARPRRIRPHRNYADMRSAQPQMQYQQQPQQIYVQQQRPAGGGGAGAAAGAGCLGEYWRWGVASGLDLGRPRPRCKNCLLTSTSRMLCRPPLFRPRRVSLLSGQAGTADGPVPPPPHKWPSPSPSPTRPPLRLCGHPPARMRAPWHACHTRSPRGTPSIDNQVVLFSVLLSRPSSVACTPWHRREEAALRSTSIACFPSAPCTIAHTRPELPAKIWISPPLSRRLCCCCRKRSTARTLRKHCERPVATS